ncbi:hypothetical protein NX034_23930, partial [Escherichia coli]|nr:hypothetical protein [Escherichia coli]
DYNIAIDYIIGRLIDSGVNKGVVYLASSSTGRHIPSIAERKIHPDDVIFFSGKLPFRYFPKNVYVSDSFEQYC